MLPNRALAILRYHAICRWQDDAYAAPGICISPAAFDQHARYLAANYSVLALPEAVDRLRTGQSLPRNAVAITFDDGYADNLNAAKTLHRYGLTATFFLTTDCLADGEPFWPAEIRLLIPSIPRSSLQLVADDAVVTIPLDRATGLEPAIRTVTQLFKSHPIRVRESMREQLRTAAGKPKLPRVMLRWDEVREMRRLGMTMGSHTQTHPNLPSAGLEAATREIVRSKARLERELGEPVTLFSYPNGGAERYETPELRRVVADAGYTAATTSRNAFARHGSNLYALERVQVQERLEDLAFALEVERFIWRPAPRHGEAS